MGGITTEADEVKPRPPNPYKPIKRQAKIRMDVASETLTRCMKDLPHYVSVTLGVTDTDQCFIEIMKRLLSAETKT